MPLINTYAEGHVHPYLKGPAMNECSLWLGAGGSVRKADVLYIVHCLVVAAHLESSLGHLLYFTFKN